ncbi:MAG TPA: hypothetical protein VGD22_11065 [Sphingobacteriaceae bacterium]
MFEVMFSHFLFELPPVPVLLLTITYLWPKILIADDKTYGVGIVDLSTQKLNCLRLTFDVSSALARKYCKHYLSKNNRMLPGVGILF